MSQLMSGAESPVVTNTADIDRGDNIKRRVDALGITDREWHATTGIDRKTLHRAIRNEPGTRAGTYTAIEAWLDKLERRQAGEPVAMPRGHVESEDSGVVRIRLEGVFGAEAAIVEAPADNPDALAAALDIIMRRRKQWADEEGGESHP